MRHVIHAAFCLMSFSIVSGCACPPLPVVVAPDVVAREDALPEMPLSSVSIPVAIPVSEVQRLVLGQVELPNAPDYEPVGEAEQSPEVSIRYQTQLLTPELKSEGDTLHLVLPIAYHGSLRARAKTPFGWVWLTQGTDWGSAEKPGHIKIHIQTKVLIRDDFSLATETELTKIELTTPAIEKVCTSGVLKVCIPVSLVEGRVHREIEGRVRAAIADNLQYVDSDLANRLPLGRLMKSIWRDLEGARTLVDSGKTLELSPEQLGIGLPEVLGDALVSQIRVWCRPTFRETSEAPRKPPLPLPSKLPWDGDHLRFAVPLSMRTLERAFAQRALEPEYEEAGIELSEVKLMGTGYAESSWLLSITLQHREAKHTVYARARIVPAQTTLQLREVELTPDSRKLLTRLRIGPDVLIASLEHDVSVDLTPLLDEQVNALRESLGNAVAPWPTRPLAQAQPNVQGVYAKGAEVVLDVQL